MKRAVEVVREAKVKKEMEDAQLQAQKAAEAAKGLEQNAKRSWYKFW
jgi:hypothetical protein